MERFKYDYNSSHCSHSSKTIATDAIDVKGDLKVGQRYIAACHDVVSAQHAQEIGCDAILLSPVFEYTSHPSRC